jgi:hypothetical protein
MRRYAGGVGCGARGRGRTYPRSREASGRRPPLLWGAALQWAGRGADEGGESLRIGLAESRPGRRPEVTAPGTEIAAVERREAPASCKRGCGKTEDWCATWRSTPSIFRGEREGKTAYPAPVKNTGADAWLFENLIRNEGARNARASPLP